MSQSSPKITLFDVLDAISIMCNLMHNVKILWIVCDFSGRASRYDTIEEFIVDSRAEYSA